MFVVLDNQDRIGDHSFPGRLPSLILANTFTTGPNTFNAGSDSVDHIVINRNSATATGTAVHVKDEAGASVAFITASTGAALLGIRQIYDVTLLKTYWDSGVSGIGWEAISQIATNVVIAIKGASSQTGVLLQLRGQSSTSERQQADLDTVWQDDTDASRKGALVARVWDTAARDLFRGDTDGSGANFVFFSGNTGSYGGGRNVIFLPNAAVNPSSNPTGGGILYSDAGAGKWRGSGGTTSTFGPAEPHCPVCGTDYGHEWSNQRWGRLHVCMNCLVDWIALRNGNRIPAWITRGT